MIKTQHIFTSAKLQVWFYATIFFCIGVLASCSSNDVIEKDTPEDEVPMTFGANVSESTQTRAIIENVSGLQSIGFGVYGYKQKTSGTAYKIFSNQSVTWDTSVTPNKWTYSPLKYWDKSQGMKYYFTAYAPRVTNEESATDIYASSADDAHSITINNIPQWQDVTTSDNTAYDLIVADTSGVASSTTDFPDNTVYFKFHHKLALLEVVAKADPSTSPYTYKIKSITIGGDDSGTKCAAVPNEDRTYTHIYAGTPTDEFSTWTPASDASLYSKTSGQITAVSATSLCKWLVVPFDAKDSRNIPIKITYYQTDSSGNLTSGTSEVTTGYISTGLNGFVSNCKYTLTISITTVGVTVDEVDVKEWNDEETDYPLWNW